MAAGAVDMLDAAALARHEDMTKPPQETDTMDPAEDRTTPSHGADAPGYDILLGGAVVPRETSRAEDAVAAPLSPAAAATVTDPRDYETYVPRHAAKDDTEPLQQSVEPDPQLFARSPLPSRKARRASRPRVPSFDRVNETARHQGSPEHGAVESAQVQAAQSDVLHAEPEAPSAEPRPARVAFTSVERLPRPTHPRVLTVANQKGGVGKTTTTVNVAAALAQAGLKVLVIDIDPQGNASTALGIDHDPDVPSVYDVIVDGAPLDDVMKQCPDIPGLWCVPATIDLAGAEIELVSLVARESRLHRAINAQLASTSEAQQFDYVLIDCPPSLGLLTVNAFVAADEVFIPIQCEYYALEGLSQLLKNIEMIKMHLNPGLHVSTILLTMYDARTNLAVQVVEEVRTHFPEQVLGTLVPRSVRISEAPSHGETVMTYDPACSGATSYRNAAREIAMRGIEVPMPAGRIGR